MALYLYFVVANNSCIYTSLMHLGVVIVILFMTAKWVLPCLTKPLRSHSSQFPVTCCPDLKHSFRRASVRGPAWYSSPPIVDGTLSSSSTNTASSLSRLPSMLRSLMLAEPGTQRAEFVQLHPYTVTILFMTQRGSILSPSSR